MKATWNPVKELKAELITYDRHVVYRMWNPVKELKVCELLHQLRIFIIYVESGEGIESC